MIIEYQSSQELFAKLASVYQDSKLIIYPTESFYAIGCPISAMKSIKYIYKIKGRDANKPLPMIVDSLVNLNSIIKIDTKELNYLDSLNSYPLTIVFEALDKKTTKNINTTDNSLACRRSFSKTAGVLTKYFNEPIVSTSANKSGQAAVRFFNDLDKILIANDAVILIKPAVEESIFNQASTIVKYDWEKKLTLLRAGSYTKEKLQQDLKAGWQLLNL